MANCCHRRCSKLDFRGNALLHQLPSDTLSIRQPFKSDRKSFCKYNRFAFRSIACSAMCWQSMRTVCKIHNIVYILCIIYLLEKIFNIHRRHCFLLAMAPFNGTLVELNSSAELKYHLLTQCWRGRFRIKAFQNSESESLDTALLAAWI